MTSRNITTWQVIPCLMRLKVRLSPAASVQPKRKFSRTLFKMASISLICAGFANVALASTVRLTISQELPANRANIQSGLAANATPTPSTTSNTGVLAFADYIQNRETKGWSSEVYRKYEKEQVIGKLILDLSGTIVEIDKDSHGFYLALNVKAGDPKIDAYAYIPEREILNFSANQGAAVWGHL